MKKTQIKLIEKARKENKQIKNGKYRIIQMYGYHNEECPQEVWGYVYGFLRPKKKRRAA